MVVGGFLWFGQPDIGLEPPAIRLLGLISATLIFWVFRALPDYGVALLFAMIVILTKLDSAQTVMGGFASTTWFMTLGVLGLGAAITGSGLFYRLSLHLVRMFPLSYYWQIIATGIMGVVVMALLLVFVLLRGRSRSTHRPDHLAAGGGLADHCQQTLGL